MNTPKAITAYSKTIASDTEGKGLYITQKTPFQNGKGFWKWDRQAVWISDKQIKNITK